MAVVASEAQPEYTVRSFNIRDGLAANRISGMEQDSRGLMWVATWNGLCCYDGYQFTTFASGPWGSTDALSTNRISMIRADSHDNIWVRTYDGGLYLYDTYKCRYVNVGLLVEQKFGTSILPRNIYVLPGGHTWITDERGKMNLRIDDDHPTDVDHMEVLGDEQHPLFGKYIRKVEADAEGHEWIITDRGLMCYGTTLTREAGDESSDAYFPSFATKADEEDSRVSDFLQSKPHIEKYHIDHQGNLWYSSARGLSLVNFQHHRMRLVPLETEQETRSLVIRRDGSIWAGTTDGSIGIFQRDGRQQGWLSAQGSISSARTRFADRIYALFEDSQGRLWIGTKGQGLYIIGVRGDVTHCQPDARDPYSLGHRDVYDFDEDADGNMWIATFGGGLNLVRKGGGLRFLHRGNELAYYPKEGFEKVRRVTHTAQGVVIASTTTGLLTIGNGRCYATRHEQGDTTSLRTNDVMQTLVTRSGSIYVVTLGGGIQRLKGADLLRDNLQFTLLDKLNQGAGNTLSLTEDVQGHIWVVRETSIDCYQPQSGQLLQYGPNSLSENVEPTEAQPIVTADGQLWVGVMGGLVTFDTQRMQMSDYRPNIVFIGVHFQGELNMEPVLNRHTVVVGRDQRSLTLNFAALDYEDNYLLQYAYRMDGDNRWNYIGRTPRVSFSDLPPGRHVLEVRSTNSDGVWVDNNTQLVLDVTPALWERTWVQLLILLLFIGAVVKGVLAYKQYRQQTAEREQRLENILRQYRELQDSVAAHESEVQTAVSNNAEQTAVREYKLEEPKIVDEDEQMMDALMKFIEDHMSDEDLKIEDMADAVSLGRTVFYAKVKSLVGVSPVEFLRQVRMQRAAQLVAKSRMTVAEIAYGVGFSDPKYFSKCFKKETGMTPSEYREKAMSV